MPSKVTIIGCGAVGEAIANALVIADEITDLVLYDGAHRLACNARSARHGRGSAAETV